jgi:hypothetical protein
MTRAALALLSLFLLPVDQYAHAASASESPRPLKSFWVEDFEKVIIPSDSDLYLGKTIQLKLDGSQALRVDLGYRYIAMLDGGVDATVGGLQQSLPAGSLLTRRKVSGGRISELPEGAVILCREPVQRNFGQAMASAATLGITQLAARYATDIQLCAVDADRDGKIEKLFLGGAKQQQDLDFTDITPVSYRHQENYRVGDVKFVLHAFKNIWGSINLFAAVESNGRWSDVSSLRFETDGKLTNHKTQIPVKKAKLPYEVKFGSATLLLKHYDETTGTVDVEVTKDFDLQGVDWHFAPQTIYIYY